MDTSSDVYHIDMIDHHLVTSTNGEASESSTLKRPRAPNLSWNVMFELLVQYGVEHEDHNVPKSGFVTLEDGTKVNLGQWLKSQRKLRRQGKLQPQREAELQVFVDNGTLFWDSNKKEVNADIWDRNYNALLHYAKVHQHCNVPPGYTIVDGGNTVALGIWLKDQIKTRRSGKLGAERLEKLQILVDDNLLDWDRDAVPSAQADNTWKPFYTALLQFGTMYNTYNVPIEYVMTQDGIELTLGKWLHTQREMYEIGKLPFEIMSLLQQLVNKGQLQWDVQRIEGDQDEGDCDEPSSKIIRLDRFDVSEAATVVADLRKSSSAPASSDVVMLSKIPNG